MFAEIVVKTGITAASGEKKAPHGSLRLDKRHHGRTRN
jgi:hypothetical protein